MEKVQCLIIGSGPAGYTAAIYTARANVKNLLFEGLQPGGQLTTTTTIENFPGFPAGIDGYDLMAKMREQAVNVGADVRSGFVQSVDLSKRPFVATLDGGETIEADTVIVATGASAKYLGLDDEKKYAGQGVSACATCDGFFYRKKVVAVVGGGDTACEEAHYLSNLASKVYMIVRKDYLRASAAMQQRVKEKENIEILFNTNTLGLFGENTAFLNGQLELDEQGYIVTNKVTTATSVEGVFAAGDVADPRYRQAVAAAGTGCRAALDVEKFLASL